MDDHKSYDASDPTEGWHPRPIYRELALHRWEMGQVLHPAQFRAQEDALLEHVGLRAQLTGLPGHGVALLPWSDAQLAAGDLSLAALTVVLPSGLLIDYPGNSILTTRNLSLPPKGAGPVPIYLHVRAERRPDDARDLTPYQDDEREVRRAIYQIEISAEPRLENVQERMKLADLSFHAGAWGLAGYVPPLLRIGRGTSPFLRDTLDQVVAALAAFESELVKRAADSLAGGEQLSEVRRVLGAVFRTRAALADHGYGGATQTVALHPYHLFAALRDFYLGAVAPQGASGQGATQAADLAALRYQHDDLRACFGQIARGLTRSLSTPSEVSLRLPFHRDDYWFVTEAFPDELRAASQVFLLIERDVRAAAAGTGELPLDDLKLASPLRAEEVYTRALEGVPRRMLPSLGFAQTFGDRATVFQLDSKSREWQQAVAEGALCFAALPGLEDISAALFWQSSGHG
ncbi:MAG TPA: type VI secretion system baseplate subunit TssK [Kofleriaceae bacterium]|nr:type VI secretion system baseplate subunit TssK [Kofleriaceae bacterium]